MTDPVALAVSARLEGSEAGSSGGRSAAGAGDGPRGRFPRPGCNRGHFPRRKRGLGQRLLYRADEARLVVQPPGLFVPNDGDQGRWLTWASDGYGWILPAEQAFSVSNPQSLATAIGGKNVPACVPHRGWKLI
jgi:hypothetical protein